MNVKELFTDDDAVSPVIGVILMVAITVILAAVIGAFVLNIGGSQESAPQVSWDWQDKSNNVVLRHGGGDKVKNPSQISITGDVSNLKLTDSGNVTDAMSAGDEWWLTSSELSGTTGTLELIWESSDGSDSQILNTHDYDIS